MRPAQLSRHCRDNWLVWEHGGEFDHPTWVLFPEPAPIIES